MTFFLIPKQDVLIGYPYIDFFLLHDHLGCNPDTHESVTFQYPNRYRFLHRSQRSHPSGATTNNNVFMAAVLLSKLAPSLPENGKAYAMAQEAVDTIKENNLDSQPSVVVPLNVAKGDDNVTIRPLKV